MCKGPSSIHTSSVLTIQCFIHTSGLSKGHDYVHTSKLNKEHVFIMHRPTFRVTKGEAGCKLLVIATVLYGT